MADHLIVPVDGSHESWRAFDVALALAKVCNGRITVVEVVDGVADVSEAKDVMHSRVTETDLSGVDVATIVELTTSDIATALKALLDREEGAMFVMGSHGRGRSAALLGSITDELLRTTFGPMIVVGPHAEVPDFSGPILVTVDGSDVSESAVPLAAAWAIELGSPAWLV